MLADSNFYDQPIRDTDLNSIILKFNEYCFIKLIKFKKPTKKVNFDAMLKSLELIKYELKLQDESFLNQDSLVTNIKSNLGLLENSILEYQKSAKTSSPGNSASEWNESIETASIVDRLPIPPPPPPPPPMPPLLVTTKPLKIAPPKIELKTSLYTLKRTPSLSRTQLKSQKQSLRKISTPRSLSGTPINTPVKQIVTGNDYFFQELQKKFHKDLDEYE